MARGRFLSKSLSDDPDFNLVLNSDFSRLLWVMLVTHLDVEGRFWAEPLIVTAKVLPWRGDVALDQVEEALQEYEDLGFIVRYQDSKGLKVLQAVKFAKHQRGLRKDREAPSIFPAPPPELLPACSAEIPDSLTDDAGAEPEPIRSQSGANPEAGLPEVKGKEQAKGKAEEQAASIRPPPAAALIKALKNCSILGDNTIATLCADSWLTPERIYACQDAVSKRENVRNPVGLLVQMLRDHDEPPAPVPRPEDDPYRYIKGKYAEFIQS